MSLLFFIRLSWHNLRLQGGRSWLTILGIIIGVAAVIAVMAVGAGAQELLLSQIKSLGSNLLGILPGGSDQHGPPATALGLEVNTLTYSDALALKKLPHYQAVTAYVSGLATVVWGQQAQDVDYLGVDADYLKVENTRVKQGRFFRESEVNGLARLAVLGSQVKEDFFGQANPLNQEIKINQISFRVIGVMEERGGSFLQNQDKQILLPLKTAQRLLLGINHLGFIRARIDKEENLPLAILEAEKLLRFRHQIKDPAKDDFSIRSTAQALDILGTVTQALKIFLAAVAAISLLVGGIGIMNIMFVTINERTREIGLRKALGARQKNILIQFLIESALLTLSGGLLGIVLGVLIAWAIALSINLYGYNWQLIVSPASILIALAMSLSLGLLFGLWPAYRASRLEAIKALRHE